VVKIDFSYLTLSMSRLSNKEFFIAETGLNKRVLESSKKFPWLKHIFGVLILIGGGLGCSRPHEVSEGKSIDSIAIRHLAELDVDLEKPKPGEWLYGREEPGQTFLQYKNAEPVKPGKIRRIIYIQPIGEFTSIQDSIVTYTADYLAIFFGLQTKILPRISDIGIPARFHGGRLQLFSPHILDSILSPSLPKDAVVMMAVTARDLYPGPTWNFVFGQARLKHRVGVSSIFRFSIGELDSFSYPICLDRLIKTSSHEIGHMFTIQHCIHGVCVMNGSNSLYETDARPNRLCSVCLEKLHWNIGFDLHDRGDKLVNFIKRHKLSLDYELASQDVSIIDNLRNQN
jgi:archaemetzincin